MDTCINVCRAESLLCSPKTIKTLLISYTPVQNKKFRKEKRVLEKKGTSLTIIKTKKTWLYKQQNLASGLILDM